MLKRLENLNKIIDESNIEYNDKTGGFYCDNHGWKLDATSFYFDNYTLISENEDEIKFISPDLFLEILKKTEDSFYKLFSEY
tara:strand:- start:230 stop:475 length:246 start_codon:yes stop_codon:yes gene_type:complete